MPDVMNGGTQPTTPRHTRSPMRREQWEAKRSAHSPHVTLKNDAMCLSLPALHFATATPFSSEHGAFTCSHQEWAVSANRPEPCSISIARSLREICELWSWIGIVDRCGSGAASNGARWTHNAKCPGRAAVMFRRRRVSVRVGQSATPRLIFPPLDLPPAIAQKAPKPEERRDPPI